MKKWCVYIHKNKTNGKIYVGKTSKKPEYRWNEGKGYSYHKHFWNSILKYGWYGFEHIIVARNLSKEKTSELEMELIKRYQAMNPEKGYNQTAGGEGMLGWHHTENSKAKIAHSNHVRGVTEKTKEKMSRVMKEKYTVEQTPPFFGKHHTEEAKKKLAEAHLGKPGHQWTEEAKQKLSLARKGKKREVEITEEWKQHLSEGIKKSYQKR